MSGVVAIGCPHGRLPPEPGWTTVAIDVIRASTTAITAVERGLRCFPVASLETAVPLAARLPDPLLAGELGGSLPYGFHVQNSPVEMTRTQDPERPVVLLSTSGTRLMAEAAASGAALVACLRNVHATAAHLVRSGRSVRLLGADSRGEFREEDKLCCARIAGALTKAGFAASDRETKQVVSEWGDAPVDAFLGGHSSEYLRRTGQERDLEFVLAHVDDLDAVFALRRGELVPVGG